MSSDQDAAVAIDQHGTEDELGKALKAMPSGDVAVAEPLAEVGFDLLIEARVARAGLVSERACRVNDEVGEDCADSGEIIIQIAGAIHQADALGRSPDLLGGHIAAGLRSGAGNLGRIEAGEGSQPLTGNLPTQGRAGREQGNGLIDKVHRLYERTPEKSAKTVRRRLPEARASAVITSPSVFLISVKLARESDRPPIE